MQNKRRGKQNKQQHKLLFIFSHFSHCMTLQIFYFLNSEVFRFSHVFYINITQESLSIFFLSLFSFPTFIWNVLIINMTSIILFNLAQTMNHSVWELSRWRLKRIFILCVFSPPLLLLFTACTNCWWQAVEWNESEWESKKENKHQVKKRDWERQLWNDE